MLHLTKWYLDVVTPEGTALIAYAASLRWGGLHVEFASTLVARPDSAPREETAWTGVRLPEADEGGLTFRHDTLGVEGRWHPGATRVAETLLDDEVGRLHWDCVLPSGAATVQVRGETLAGRGYAECLTMTRPPGSLPLRTLRWGRFASASHALVWIGWEGGEPRRWVWLDGVPQPGAVIGDGGVHGLDGGIALRLAPGRELCDRRALKVLSRRLPALDALPIGPLGGLREIKRLDRGRLGPVRGGEDEGWAIHERVTW